MSVMSGHARFHDLVRRTVAVARIGALAWLATACGSTASPGVYDAGVGLNSSGGSGGGGTSSGGPGSGGTPGQGSSGGSSGASSSGPSMPGSLGDGGGAQASGSDGGGGTAPEAGAACTKVITPSMDCSAPLAPGDSKTCMLGTRQYLLYAPKTLNVCQPTALVIDAHGATQSAPSQLLGMPAFCTGATCWNGPGSGWRLEAETPGGGFVLVTPASATSANTWDTTSDPMFMVQIVAAIEKVAMIDPKRVYMTGISNGAELSYATGCMNPDVFAGISPNSGGTLGGTFCNTLSKPLADIQFDDMPDFAFSDSQSSVTNLAKVDNCKSGPTAWKTFDSTTTDPVCLKNPDDNATTLVPCNTITPAVQPTTCQLWDQCDGGVRVVFCTVAAGTLHGAANAAIDGHIIYENDTNLNTPSVAWRFFQGIY
jgi:poly(3-hydroxybutyrate) depolymerase